MEPLRIIVLTGPPGAGKSEIARRLAVRARVPAASLDGDRVADIHPWSVDDRLYRLIARNVEACLPGLRSWGVRLVVLSAVLVPGRALEHFAGLLADPAISWRFFGLWAAESELRRRVHTDSRFQDIAERISWQFLVREVEQIPGVSMVDTTGLAIGDVVDLLARQEPEWFHPNGADGPAAPPPDVRASVARATAVAASALRRAGFPAAVAADTASDLVEAEVAAVPAHGLLRVPEYVAGAMTATVDPAAAPSVTRAGSGIVVHGNRAPAVVLRRVVARTLVEEATGRGFAIVSVRDGAHLDRLTPLAELVTAAGLVVVGWVNAAGGGQLVAPPGAATARLAANPMMFGCPAPPGHPVVLELSTSTTTGGAVRAAWHAGRLVAGDQLRDRRGRPVRDPAEFCADRPEAYLTSLGGSAAEKGAALAATVEILAGIVGGGGFVAQPGPAPGSAGLFVAFPATALGRDLGAVGAEIGALQTHLTGPPHTAQHPAGLPGLARPAAAATHVEVPQALWNLLEQLAAPSATVRSSQR